MGFLTQLSKEYKRVSIVGMAKNAGKTTTLNYLIEEAMDEGVILGITSTGRDGETTDLVTGTEKPKVYLDVGTIVSVPVQLYELSDAGLEILRMTRYSTALGQLMLCRVAESGYVQIAGPVNTADHKKMCEEMMELGAQLILIDGAVDRRSIAAPGTSDAIILATGAVLSRNMKKLVEETLHIVRIYQSERLSEGSLREKIVAGATQEKIMLVKKGELTFLDLLTGLTAGKYLDEAIDKDTECVYIPGALTQGVIGDIHPSKLKDVLFVLKDPTKIFIDAGAWQQLLKRGLRVSVLENIKIAAVTVNPYAPSGYSFAHGELLTAMQEAAGELPVIDVKYEEKLCD
ncbi:MAG: hypothetical protein PHQ50_01675 [Eubacteriales bacterium]|nr:hypothetical protein [Eubacteriales bacterium]MDD3349904.1 hypothetical protein [Eubacteriales bacterium]